MKLKDFKSVKDRRVFIEKKLSLSLDNIGSFTIDEAKATSRNCENMIGAAQIPLGIAGPIKIKNLPAGEAGLKLKIKNYYVPLATTEGALIASVNRGCKAITESGGASVFVEEVGTTRGPVFKTEGLRQSLEFKTWLDQHFNDLNHQSKKTSSHINLRKIDTRVVGKYVYVRFYFDTEEAMGMNMVTIATTSINQFIESETGVRCLSVAGNFDIDKKPAWLNIISGRGRRVWAEAVIPQKVLKETLKTTATSIYDVWLGKCLLGSAISGSLGFNAHFANMISALFLATGQDLAHIVEGSAGITTTELIDSNLYISVYLPSLMVGTIGGGTTLATQKESLSILGIKGEKGDTDKLAKICAGVVLAGELSLLASLSEGSLAKAHAHLAQGKLLK
ncbi:hydroxymethylglutaryl-CoA reductase [Candidatus Gottesmanbacteria bacterium]|nr:hydroxymethylglutaryl-CoA reductase [Candidatus Gottesmanbacteria bacterium]